MKEFSPYYAKLNLVEMFNEADKTEENEMKKNNNDNMNENIIINNCNWKQNDGIKRLCKKIDFNYKNQTFINISVICFN